MKKFMVLYLATISAQEQMQNMSAEDMKKGMEPWMEWAKKCGENLVDFGTPLINGQRLTKSGSSPSDSNIAGYSVLQANDIEGAKALLEGHPHLKWMEGAGIDVFELAPMEM
jgi:hypothetical protein